MKYKIFQIKLTDAEVDIVKDKRHDSVSKNSMRLDMNLMANDTDKIPAIAFNLSY